MTWFYIQLCSGECRFFSSLLCRPCFHLFLFVKLLIKPSCEGEDCERGKMEDEVCWRAEKQKLTLSLFLYLSQLFSIFSHLEVLSTSVCFCCVENKSDTLMTSSLAPCLSAFTSDGNRCQSILTVKREKTWEWSDCLLRGCLKPQSCAS